MRLVPSLINAAVSGINTSSYASTQYIPTPLATVNCYCKLAVLGITTL